MSPNFIRISAEKLNYVAIEVKSKSFQYRSWQILLQPTKPELDTIRLGLASCYLVQCRFCSFLYLLSSISFILSLSLLFLSSLSLTFFFRNIDCTWLSSGLLFSSTTSFNLWKHFRSNMLNFTLHVFRDRFLSTEDPNLCLACTFFA